MLLEPEIGAAPPGRFIRHTHGDSGSAFLHRRARELLQLAGQRHYLRQRLPPIRVGVESCSAWKLTAAVLSAAPRRPAASAASPAQLAC